MRIVIKIGTSTLAHESGRLNIRRTEKLCRIISDLKNSGIEVILVSSGAIGMGLGELGFVKRPEDMATKQALAAVGQCELMYTYDRLFSQYNHVVAQILITASDIRDEERHQNFSVTLNRLLELGVIPVINENDSIATEEIAFGDNDTLGAIVATSAKADLLVMLTDIDGLYTANPRKDKNARIIPEVRELSQEIMACGESAGGNLGTGGMKTKLMAAEICMAAGCDMIIACGKDPECLYDIADGIPVGTRFYGERNSK